MLEVVGEKGIIAKCRYCFALNPNPQKVECWQCGRDGLRCPKCDAKPYLRYSIETNKWKCPNAACSKSFTYMAEVKDTRYVLSDEVCSNCKKSLYWDTEMWVWRCLNNSCKRIYTHDDLHKEQEAASGDKERDVVKRKLKARFRVRWLTVLLVLIVVVVFIIIVWATLGNHILDQFRRLFS